MIDQDFEPPELAQKFLDSDEQVGKWIRPPRGSINTFSDDQPQTMEIELEPLDVGPTALSEMPPPPPATWIKFGCALAKALVEPHNNGSIINPTARSLEILMDGRIHITGPGIVIECPKPHTEPPSQRSDVYAAAIILLEVFLGKTWPRDIPASKIVPYLRGVLPGPPPAALAPIDAALHPNPAQRPQNGQEWFDIWAMAAKFETRRLTQHHVRDAIVDYGYDTHIGHHKILFTQTNQDSLYAATRDELSLLAVCDGISTANAGSGDVASGITTHVIASLWEQAISRLEEAEDTERSEFLSRSLRMANRAV